MIFRQVAQVLDGTKTQTRRPVYPEERLIADRAFGLPDQVVTTGNLRGYCGRVLKWAVDRTYAVQPGRGKKAVGRIRITKIRRERLDAIEESEADCFAEGIWEDDEGWSICPTCDGKFFAPSRAFRHLWNHIYPENSPYHWIGGWAASDIAEKLPEVWVLDFERSEG